MLILIRIISKWDCVVLTLKRSIFLRKKKKKTHLKGACELLYREFSPCFK